jgi:hypothetical protein
MDPNLRPISTAASKGNPAWLISFFVSFVCFCSFSATQDNPNLFISTTDFLGQPLTNRAASLMMPYGSTLYGTNLIVPEIRRATTDITGCLTFTNVTPGNYQLTIQASPLASWRLYIRATNGTLTAVECITNYVSPASVASYSMAAADARFAPIGSGGSGGSLSISTNGTSVGTIAAGSTLTIATNGTTAGTITL